MTESEQAPGQRIRSRLDHPVIDADGHCVEFVPAVRGILRDLAGEDLARQFDQVIGAPLMARYMNLDQRRQYGLFRLGWWVFPAANTRDRAAAMLPEMLHHRLDELGIDFSVIYPTVGLAALNMDDRDLRQAMTRAFNRYMAECYGPWRDRLAPVAVIPMHSPDEAVTELHHAVDDLGLRAVVMAGSVWRPLPGGSRDSRWLDSFGLDSAHDYDPVWQACLDLGVTPTFHTSAMGWPARNSPTNYVFNHVGNFAHGNELTCRSLIMGGVFNRFPELHMAFLEGGVGWALNLYADLLGHWEKRNREALQRYNPAKMDRRQMRDWFEEMAPACFRPHLDRLDEGLAVYCDPDEPAAGRDEFARTGFREPEDISRLFERNLFFGCEADDAMNTWAFNAMANPLGARLQPVFSSDIGHWDVPDMRAVLPEAWELVEEGLMTADDFRDFTFANAQRLLTAHNRDFFADTVIGKVTSD